MSFGKKKHDKLWAFIKFCHFVDKTHQTGVGNLTTENIFLFLQLQSAIIA